VRTAARIFLAGCVLAFFAGCEDANKATREKSDILTGEKKLLQYQLEQCNTENENLKKQVEVLAGIKQEARFENLYHIQSVKLTKHTGFYDKNKDGKKESLIVYIQPMDEQGDIVKATGAVEVELWDLNKKDGQAMLGTWRVEPNELKTLWFAGFMGLNYRLTFDVADKIEGVKEPLTVKVIFTDYLTGKEFNEQAAVKL
jgi:hypothetical protein